MMINIFLAYIGFESEWIGLCRTWDIVHQGSNAYNREYVIHVSSSSSGVLFDQYFKQLVLIVL